MVFSVSGEVLGEDFRDGGSTRERLFEESPDKLGGPPRDSRERIHRSLNFISQIEFWYRILLIDVNLIGCRTTGHKLTENTVHMRQSSELAREAM